MQARSVAAAIALPALLASAGCDRNLEAPTEPGESPQASPEAAVAANSWCTHFVYDP
jgi:hypothetical protein